MPPLNHAVVICTVGRIRETEIALRTQANQTMPPQKLLIVIPEDVNQIQTWLKPVELLKELGTRVFLIKTKKGLRYQRNAAIQFLANSVEESNIISFIDDDIILPINFNSLIISEFESSEGSDLVGCGGITMDCPKNGVINPGRITETGDNTVFLRGKGNYEVEWLPGCCMSFKFEDIQRRRFDAGPFWGEDVRFSYSLINRNKYKKLRILDIPLLLHNQSRIERMSDYDKAKELAAHKSIMIKQQHDLSFDKPFRLSIFFLQLVVRLGVNGVRKTNRKLHQVITVRVLSASRTTSRFLVVFLRFSRLIKVRLIRISHAVTFRVLSAFRTTSRFLVVFLRFSRLIKVRLIRIPLLVRNRFARVTRRMSRNLHFSIQFISALIRYKPVEINDRIDENENLDVVVL